MATAFESFYPTLEPFVLFLEATALNLNLICVAHCSVDQIEAVVGPIAFLLDNGDVLAQCLLGILKLTLQALHILLLHHLLVRLFEGNFSSQVLDFPISLRLYARDLFLLTSSPYFVEVAEQRIHE